MLQYHQLKNEWIQKEKYNLGLPKCNKSHHLDKLDKSPYFPEWDKIVCEVCDFEKEVTPEEVCYSCKECEFDLCNVCYQAEFAKKEKENIEKKIKNFRFEPCLN